MDTIRRLEWKSVFDTVHGYLFRYHKAGDDRIRPSAGSDNADLHAENSRAVVSTVYGSTVKWNQLYNATAQKTQTINGITVTNNGDGSFTFSGNTDTNTPFTNINFPTFNHTYAFMGSRYLRIYLNGNSSVAEVGTFSLKTYTGLTNSDILFVRFRFPSGTNFSTPITVYPKIFDLTAMGIDNITTYAQFQNWLALNVGYQDSYPYDEGSLISFSGTAVKSVGFNQWDEQWEAGIFNTTTGVNQSGGASQIRSKILIPIFPNTPYYCPWNYLWMIFYNNSKEVITAFVSGARDRNGNSSMLGTGTFTTPNGAYYMRFYTTNNYAATYQNNLCINLSCEKNGTYAPYWEDSVDLSFAQNATGKLLVEEQPTGESVVVFSDGMKSASSVHDTAIVDDDGYIRKVTKNFTNTVKYKNRTGWYYGSVDNTHPYGYIRFPQNSGVYGGQISSTSYSKGSVGFYVDKCTFIGNGFIYIIDSSYTSTTSFLQDHGEDSCFWQISTEEYLLDTPIVATYKVDKYSTEELIVPTSQTGAPTSTALNADIDYQYRG